eukprot:885510-Rhodomonas_salina.1
MSGTDIGLVVSTSADDGIAHDAGGNPLFNTKTKEELQGESWRFNATPVPLFSDHNTPTMMNPVRVCVFLLSSCARAA